MAMNGNTKFYGVGLVLMGMLIAAVLSFAHVQSKASENSRRIEAIESNNGQVLETLHRIDKRQALIMQKLDIPNGQ